MGDGPLSSPPPRASRSVRVRDPDGLHARPCAELARAALRFRCRVVVVFEGREADARSVLELVGLCVLSSSEVEVRAEGERAEECVALLAELLGRPV